jgi:hypothetical protein
MSNVAQEASEALSEFDAVSHPQHYCTGKYECFEVMTEVFGVEAVKGFCLCNAFKYLFRCENKNNKLQDIKKSRWYIDKLISILEAENENNKA